MMDGVVKRQTMKIRDGSIDLIEIDEIFYLEALGENTLIGCIQISNYRKAGPEVTLPTKSLQIWFNF